MRVRSKWWWIGWFVVALIVVGNDFALLEGAAMSDPQGLTLSQFMVDLIYAWPPINLLIGLAIGVLIGTLNSHFNWPWIPRQLRATCATCGRTVLIEPLEISK